MIPAVTMLRNRNTLTHRNWRRVLVALQVGIGSFFLIMSLGMLKQFRFMADTDKGMSAESIYQLRLGFYTTVEDECAAICEELKASAYVEEVTKVYSTLVLLSNGQFNAGDFFYLSGREKGMESDNIMYVEENFLSFFGMKLKEGRWLKYDAQWQYVINEAGAVQLGISTVGEGIVSEGSYRPQLLTGVLKNYHYAPFRFPVDKVIIRLYHPEHDEKNFHEKFIYVKIAPWAEKEALDYIRMVYDRYEKGEIPPDKQIVSLSDMMDSFNEPEKKLFRVFSVLSLISVLISSFGIYTLVSFSAQQRRREIAIRKVNGAGFMDVFKLFTREYVWLALIGNALALPVSFLFLNNWLKEYVYRITPGIGLFLPVFCITSLIVAVSVALRMGEAAAANPAEATRVI
ncbi:MAG: hypothetical protein LUD15_06465 [Bacteroides sp.]|nr:hypothetical protein [Bacteroides sp.]